MDRQTSTLVVFVGGPRDGEEMVVQGFPPYLEMAEYADNVLALEIPDAETAGPTLAINQRMYRREGLADNGARKYVYVR